jgi:pimeloyl-ACP methyl ester carboxylesterase
MASPKAFSIAVPEFKIQRLKQKLSVIDWPSEADDADSWSRGPPLRDIKRLADRWANGWDWRNAESRFNAIPQFMTNINIDGFGDFNVHFIHQRSSIKHAIPLCFVHGWPGSFIEVTKILPMLVEGSPDQPAFHVVCPSLINFGFSDECTKPGFNVNHHAETCHKLMLQLGYSEYVTQGGDLGYFATHLMALKYSQHVKGWHINMMVPERPDPKKHPELMKQIEAHNPTARDEQDARRRQDVATNLMGYYRIQETKPALMAIALTDSPVALLSWIYDKLHTWSDYSNYTWSDDEVLDWVSIYYFGVGGISASVRIYYESRTMKADRAFATPPMGIAHFPMEMSTFPRLWYRTMGNVVQQNDYDVGGHFPAWEQPELLVKDIRQMFGKGGGAASVIRGASGYDEGPSS